ncbi:hypothetical protein HK098_002372 [Nowakowskiella sp. JEL0407]|nr:hypothetical protein HK098_002372 [Nowakowskiella sp. JEL0407]
MPKQAKQSITKTKTKSSNAFILYRTCMLPIVRSRFPENLNQHNSIVIGKYWYHAPKATKDYYSDIATKLACIKRGELCEYSEEQLKFMAYHPPTTMIPTFNDININVIINAEIEVAVHNKEQSKLETKRNKKARSKCARAALPPTPQQNPMDTLNLQLVDIQLLLQSLTSPPSFNNLLSFDANLFQSLPEIGQQSFSEIPSFTGLMSPPTFNEILQNGEGNSLSLFDPADTFNGFDCYSSQYNLLGAAEPTPSFNLLEIDSLLNFGDDSCLFENLI